MNQDSKAKNRLQLKVLPVRRLGVDKALLEEGSPVQQCRATAGGSCQINCTGTTY
ncbi:MAG: hypothetical protein AAGC60_29225 [Acidobacteriota bacterium]